MQEPIQVQQQKTNKKSSIVFSVIILIIIAGFVSVFLMNKFSDKGYVDLKDATGNVIRVLNTEELEYNNQIYYKDYTGLWYTEIDVPGKQYVLRLHFSPEEVEDIEFIGEPDDSFQKQDTFYLTFDPTAGNYSHIAVATGELGFSFVKAFNKVPVGACTINDSDACSDREIVTCESTKEPVIFMKVSEKDPKVTFQDNCIIIEGHDYGIIKASDKLIYKMYGLIN